ncbi:LCP family protein [Actinacidiphila glaucinigra]|uniref:Transcriptional attenuator, LytR family n=1 Tax=Actinacidiphila glaucinigra TaxID=235986 RepID=A0A239LCF0_9ACTN|nr:LCP family protein [Actinacidiphila glaucinigra]SNT27985.1 transcriptional attenuator, LytR family [Actinacidiphila glaucinigra]
MNDYPRWQYAEGTPEQGGQDPYGEDPYAQQQGDYANGYGNEYGQYDPYAQQTGQQQAYQGQQAQQQGQQGYTGQQPYYPQDQQQQYQQPQQHPQQSQQPQHTQQYQGWIPQQPQYQEPYYEEQQYGQQPPAPPQAPAPQAPQQAPPAQRRPAYEEPAARPAPGRAPSGEDGFHTGQFSFVDEETEESEEVIDWLKFTESRTERREEARRRGRNRVVAAVVVLALAAVGGAGYLWKAGKIPGLGGDSGTAQQAAGGQKRDVIVLHLRPVGSEETSTALLVSNSTTKKGTTVLLPNSLAVSGEDGGSTTLGKSVVENGSAPTREALDGLLGTKISGTWRLDTPYLDNLVESLGGVLVDTDATVKAGKKKGDKTLVKPGKQQELGGQAAVAYATYRGPGEGPDKQLARFGQVVQAMLKKMYSDPDLATKTVEGLNQVIEPPLTEKDLGSSLAALSEEAKGGDYTTETLPVEPDGTLSEKATEDVVKKVLGGTVTNTDSDGIPRVTLRNATGVAANTGEAQVQIVGGGYTFVSGATAGTQAASQVLYADADQKANAEELAKTLGLSAKAAKKGEVATNADITVVLGQDYSPPKKV